MNEPFTRLGAGTNQPVTVSPAANRPMADQPIVTSPISNPDVTQSVRIGVLASSDSLTLRSHRTRAEIDAIRQALELSGWIRKRAARILAISYRSLLYKIERYKITPPAHREAPELMSQNPSQDWRVG